MTSSQDFKNIVTSEPFRFLVGDGSHEFFIHPSLISNHSQPLKALIHGRMREAKTGCAVLDDVTSDTFARFAEYLYTGDYTAAEHSVLLDLSGVPQDVEECSEGKQGDLEGPLADEADLGVTEQWQQEPAPDSPPEFDYLSTSIRKKHRKGKPFMSPPTPPPKPLHSKREKMWDSFTSMAYKYDRCPAPIPSRPNKESCEDYSEVFLSHAQIYVFADKYDIQNLRMLSLHKLHRTLADFKLFSERAPDIAVLLQYVYDHTPQRRGTMDGLRDLVSQYVACNLEHLLHDQSLRDTLKAENMTSLDLLDRLVNRLD